MEGNRYFRKVPRGKKSVAILSRATAFFLDYLDRLDDLDELDQVPVQPVQIVQKECSCPAIQTSCIAWVTCYARDSFIFQYFLDSFLFPFPFSPTDAWRVVSLSHLLCFSVFDFYLRPLFFPSLLYSLKGFWRLFLD